MKIQFLASTRHRAAVTLAVVAWTLLATSAAQAQFVISEFMAVNTSSLNDEDGNNSDWIEIHNEGTTTNSLGGWFLTGRTNNLTQWEFPATNVPPNGFLVVFASNKDRRIPGLPLHTNFRLSAQGEYLALVRPDGSTIASQFYPAFPPQVADVSYGLAANIAPVTLVETGAVARVSVPQNGSLGLEWTTEEFVDALWTSGTTGVGYDRQTIGVNYLPLLGLNVESLMYNINSTIYVRVPFTIGNPSDYEALRLRLKFEDGFVAYLNGQEVARSNAPATPTWNSSALSPRTDTSATNFVDFDITDSRGFLVAGANVLAFHALNSPSNSPDLLLVPQLVGFTSKGTPTSRYFPVPTPGKPNNEGVATLGPIVSDPQQSPRLAVDSDNLTVTASIRPAFAPVGSATLHYRVMFGAETTMPLVDDGAHGDGLAGDGVYGATIPASAASAGQMVRWYFTATDTTGTNTFRLPLFQSTNSSPAYFGTVIANPALTNPLPVFHWFVQDTAAADTAGGTRASVFYDGEFYDNVYVRVRGATAATYSKKPYKFDFNPGYHFRVAPTLPRVDEVNLNSTYQDKALARPVLSFETYQEAGVPACDAFPVRVERNGTFFSVAVYVEQVDETFLERRGLDPAGALYKMFNGINSAASGVEKKTRRDESNSDLQQLVEGLGLSNPNRGTNLFDLLDLPEVINYLAAGVVAQDWDRAIKNIYLYRDTAGTQLWKMFPWDKDLTFGKTALLNDALTAIKDGTTGASGEPYVSHPYYGRSGRNCCGVNNLFDAVYSTPATREMFLRRLRTLMDQVLQPPDTTSALLRYENRLADLSGQLQRDAALDLAKWGAGYGSVQSLAEAMSDLRTNYLAPRRTHLYGTHSLAAMATNANAVGIPDAQSSALPVAFGAIDYNPASGNQAQEFIELRSLASTAVDISGWSLEGGVQFTFAPGTVITAGGRLYVSPDVAAFRLRAAAPHGGQGLLAVGNYGGQLSARGESLRLLNAVGAAVSTTNYPGTPSAAQQFLRITELMYHPAPPPAGDTNSADNFEYIELTNLGAVPLDLNGIRLVDGVEFSFSGGAVTNLGAGRSVVVVKDAAAFALRYGTDRPVAGTYAGHLDNAGERLRLLDANNEEILDFTYDNGWFPVTDGLGFSLVVMDEHAAPNAWSTKANWRPSGLLNGSPGESDPLPPGFAPVVVNEVLTHSDPPAVDAIELHNASANLADVSGWFLTDDPATPAKFRIPDETRLPAGGFVVFSETNFNPNPGVPPSFALSSDGDEIYLFSADAEGRLTGYAHGFHFGAAERGFTFGRYLTSAGEEQFVAQATPTLGGTNAGPKIGPLVISEIMYHPPDMDGADDTLSEYVELQNITGSPVTLFDAVRPTNTWRLCNAVDFQFPTNSILPPGALLLLVSFDPATNKVARTAFCNAYGLSTNIAILGPYHGSLANSDGRLELRMPGEPTLDGTVPYILADAVHYRDAWPWPAAADGDGSSLQRWPVTAYGDDPASWVAAGRTPGAENTFNRPPAVLLTSPAAGAVFNQPASLILAAEASDSDGVVSRVEFFADDIRIGEAASSPFTFTWSNAPSGVHTLTAKAFDDRGASTASEPVPISVISLPPTVALRSPTNGSLCLASAPMTIMADARDPDGIVQKVEFFADGARLGELTEAPYAWVWTNPPMGAHTLTLRATDNAGLSAVSSNSTVTVVFGTSSNLTLVPTGSVWKYSDTGRDWGSAWRAQGFDDMLWAAGPAELGYGDTSEGRPEATVVGYGPDPADKHTTTYFRRVFAVSDAKAFTSLDMRILRDDGAVVYLNGAEVFRTGMPDGAVTFDTLATLVVADADETVYVPVGLDPALLAEGANLLAVEIHQQRVDSSDISFDLELKGTRTLVAPFIVTQPESRVVAEGTEAILAITAVGLPSPAYQWRRGDTSLPGATNATLQLPAAQFTQDGVYTVVVSNSVGSVTSAPTEVKVYAEGDYARTVLADQPIHYYRFDETNGSAAGDIGIPGGKPGALAGGVVLNQPSASAVLGRSAHFDGAPGTFVNLGLFHPGNGVTLEAWVSLDPDANNSPSYNAIVARWEGSYELDLAPGDAVNLVARNQAGEMGLMASPMALERGRWHHLAAVYDGGMMQLYVNGTLAGSLPLAGTLRNGGPTPDRVLIGATRDGSNASFQWKGLIDEVAFYNYALSPVQILAHYFAATPPPVRLSISSAGLIAWPNFDPAYVLQVTDSLVEPVSWKDHAAAPVADGAIFKVAVSLSDGARYYRLIRR